MTRRDLLTKAIFICGCLLSAAPSLAQQFVHLPRRRGTGGSSSTISVYNVAAIGWITTMASAKLGEAPDGLVVQGYSTQCDVRNRWPGGSIKLAQLTFLATSTGNVNIGNGTPASGTFTPTVPTASVTAVITTGEVTGTYVATLPSGVNTGDMWEDGPNVRSWRRAVVPDASSTPHPTIRCFFDVRAFSDGTSKVSYWWANFKDTTNGARVIADYTIALNGVTQKSESSVWTALYGFWRREYPSATHSAGHIKPDFLNFERTKIIQKFLYIIEDNPDYRGDISSLSLSPTVSAGFVGPLDINLQNGSKRAAIGIGITSPNLAALTHKTAGNLAYVEKIAETLGMSYGHVTFGDGVEPVDIDTNTLYTMDYSHGPGTVSPYSTPSRNCNPTNCQIPGWTDNSMQENAHRHSGISFFPYLWTGARFYYDLQRMNAIGVVLQTKADTHGDNFKRSHNLHEVFTAPQYAAMTQIGSGDSPYKNHQGVITSPPSEGNQVRGWGRGLYEIVNAWIVTTDAQGGVYTKARMQDLVETNVDHYEMQCKEWSDSDSVVGPTYLGGNPLKIAFANTTGGIVDGVVWNYIPWTQTLLVHAVQRAIDQGLTTLPGGFALGNYGIRRHIHTLLLGPKYWLSTTGPDGAGDYKRFSYGYNAPMWLGTPSHPVYPSQFIKDLGGSPTPQTHMDRVWTYNVGGGPGDTNYTSYGRWGVNYYYQELYSILRLAKTMGGVLDVSMASPVNYDHDALLTYVEGYPHSGAEIGDPTRTEITMTSLAGGHNWDGLTAL